jgi:hypothetical protein
VPVPGAERIDLDAARDDLYVLAYSKVTILRAIGTTAPASLDREGWEGAEAVFLRGAAFGP